MTSLADLVVCGSMLLSLGTIREGDGVVERTFMLCNEGKEPVTFVQGYTSCGCTTIQFPKDSLLAAGDSATITLRFNPRGKSGPFYESGTVVYVASPTTERQRLQLTLEGECESSDETLLRQYPFSVAPELRASAREFDLGNVQRGQHVERYLSLLWTKEGNARQLLKLDFTPPTDLKAGINHVQQKIPVSRNGKTYNLNITYHINLR